MSGTTFGLTRRPISLRGFAAIAAAVTLVACGDSDPGAPSTTTATTTPAAGPTVEASDRNFVVTMPKQWRSQPAKGLIIQLVAADGATVDAVSDPADRGRTIQVSAETAAESTVHYLHGVIDPRGIESTTVDGEPARRFTYNVPASSGTVSQDTRVTALFVRHRDIEYSVTFSGTPQRFDAAVAEFDAIMASWKWLT
jgi:hypothetical protein